MAGPPGLGPKQQGLSTRGANPQGSVASILKNGVRTTTIKAPGFGSARDKAQLRAAEADMQPLKPSAAASRTYQRQQAVPGKRVR